jgi:hypothetical protein
VKNTFLALSVLPNIVSVFTLLIGLFYYVYTGHNMFPSQDGNRWGVLLILCVITGLPWIGFVEI